MRFSFKRGLFGYNRSQVDACVEELDKQLKKQQEDYEARIKQVVEENVNLAVELKVARSGYKDSAELMMAAQSRVRDLERYLDLERQRVAKLEQQQLKLKQGIVDEPQEKPDESVSAMVQSLQERIAALETVQTVFAEAQKRRDGTVFEMAEYVFPEGITAVDEDLADARGLMQRLYSLRAAEQESH